MSRILVVDDEAAIRKALVTLLTAAGHDVSTASSGEEGLASLAEREVDLVLVDMRMPGMSGLEMLQALHHRDPSLPCIVLTAHGTVRTAVEAMRAGAFDYVSKPFDNDELLLTINRALEMRRLARRVESLQRELASRRVAGIVANSEPMLEVFRLVERAAAVDETLLVTGESGTGKELVARAVHQNSSRAGGPFVPLDCGALPSELIESELFGAERGAYTGADRARKGLFEQAQDGVLFLDEAGNLTPAAQMTLLRVLQERAVRRVGGQVTIPVNVRLIAATNENLAASEQFRKDLYFRLNLLEIHLPALRDRPGDVPLLTDHFVATICDGSDLPRKQVSDEVRDLLLAYDWPGNIRELEHALRRAIVNGDGDTIVARELPPAIRGDTAGGAGEAGESSSLADAVKKVSERFERERIIEALEEAGGSRLKAADRLGVPARTFFRKLKYYGLSRE